MGGQTVSFGWNQWEKLNMKIIVSRKTSRSSTVELFDFLGWWVGWTTVESVQMGLISAL